jgi:hypothetical protein
VTIPTDLGTDLGDALDALAEVRTRHRLPTGAATFDGYGWHVRVDGAPAFAIWLPAIGAAQVSVQTRTVHSVVMAYGTARAVPVTLETSITRQPNGAYLPGLRVNWIKQTHRSGSPPRRFGVATAADFLSALEPLTAAAVS